LKTLGRVGSYALDQLDDEDCQVRCTSLKDGNQVENFTRLPFCLEDGNHAEMVLSKKAMQDIIATELKGLPTHEKFVLKHIECEELPKIVGKSEEVHIGLKVTPPKKTSYLIS
jgi:hypothetical protein